MNESRSRLLRALSTSVGVLVAIVILGGPAHGYGFRLEQVPNGDFFDCTLCHNDFGGDTRNPFGADVEATLTGARFLEGDLGLRLDLDRRYGEAEVGFFVVRTDVDTVLGLNLRLPLPVRAWSPPARIRVTTVPAFPFEYRDSLSEVGQQVSLFDDLDRLRKRLYPTFVRNNLDELLVPPSPGRTK